MKGALFARYSRSPKGLRRLFLDEFAADPESAEASPARGSEDVISGAGAARGKAEALYERVFTEYGDDSVAQLGGAHIACEDVSNILTKIVERGRLMAYLEQSTRYIQYDLKIRGGYRYANPFDKADDAATLFADTAEFLFDTYSELFEPVRRAVEAASPKSDDDPPAVYRGAVRAKVCDTLRGLLPAATLANVGLYGSGQAYEALLMRMFASGNPEALKYAELILVELKKVIPSFVRRVGMPDRGGRWIEYLSETAARSREVAEAYLPAVLALDDSSIDVTRVSLTRFDLEGEARIAGAILFEAGGGSDSACRRVVAGMAPDEIDAIFRAYVGERANRRHKPGRAFEAASYRFEIISDYGAFRDLQRHRMLTVEWQDLTTDLGFTTPDLITECGFEGRWREAMERAEETAAVLVESDASLARYIVPMAYRIRCVLEMNAREALHLIELRTSPQGHTEYRRVCLEMHRLIAEVAGHTRVAGAMEYLGSDPSDLERLEAERRAATRRADREG